MGNICLQWLSMKYTGQGSENAWKNSIIGMSVGEIQVSFFEIWIDAFPRKIKNVLDLYYSMKFHTYIYI